MHLNKLLSKSDDNLSNENGFVIASKRIFKLINSTFDQAVSKSNNESNDLSDRIEYRIVAAVSETKSLFF